MRSNFPRDRGEGAAVDDFWVGRETSSDTPHSVIVSPTLYIYILAATITGLVQLRSDAVLVACDTAGNETGNFQAQS